MPAKPDDKLHIDYPDDQTIRMTRVFDAPAELVFRAWTEPKYVRRWWICDTAGMRMTTCDIDLTVGGRWHWITEMPQGAFGFFGHYREIEPGQRLVYSENFQADPSVEPAWDGPTEASIVHLTLREQDGQTVMVSSARYESKALRDYVLSTGMEQGAGQALDRLAAIIADEAVAA